MYERAYIKESQQNAVVVPFSISGTISKEFDRSRFGRIDLPVNKYMSLYDSSFTGYRHNSAHCHCRKLLFILIVPPTGLEPVLPAPEADALSN